MEKLTTQDPKVSVVMCTYNGERYLREQLDSIVAQTYPIHELIIQDDRSTDNTVGILQEYARKYPYIRLYRNERNLGFNQNFRQAILKATGDFIAVCDQDDIWLPEKIARQVEAIGDHDICFSSYYRGTEFTDRTPVVSPLYNMERLLFTNCIPGHTMLIRKSFTLLPHVWNPHICYDWWFLICAHLNRGIVKTDIPLNFHRTHAESAIATLHREYAAGLHLRPTFQPYLYGPHRFYKLQKKKTWRSFYTFIYTHTANTCFGTARKLSELLLQKNIFAWTRLCLLCLKHRKEIYPNPDVKGIMAYIRGFFYPFINAYNNRDFEL